MTLRPAGSTPVLGPLLTALSRGLKRYFFKGSADYWERRYRSGGNSGAGSYNNLAYFKADFLNNFVDRHGISSVIEFGSGDGAQLELARYPSYVGIDVSWTAVNAARKRYADDSSKSFLHSSELADGHQAELAISLDVIYHLVEDSVFETYMQQMLDAASRFAIFYSSNREEAQQVAHVRHRRFTDWIERNRSDFVLLEHVTNDYPFDPAEPDNTSFADFYVFERK